jgi:methylmalonyl-CoA mutase
MKQDPTLYNPVNPVRIITASSLFDGHDATINIMRRIIQQSGVEVIHLGHNRSVAEIVDSAIQEDVQAVAITSYQGGHMEFFEYMRELLNENGAPHVKIFGGGGGVILPEEIYELEKRGITKIFSPDDGRVMGLTGMISYLVKESDYPLGRNPVDPDVLATGDMKSLASMISCIENHPWVANPILEEIRSRSGCARPPILGVTGTGGAGKSSLVDELVRRFKLANPGLRIAILSVDPTKRRTGGALLGDRIRMNAIHQPGIFMRSMATRQSHLALPAHISDVLCATGFAGFDLIILETSGIGQSDSEVSDYADVSLYVMTPEYGAATQLEKIDMLDFSDLVALNKFDKPGAMDALRDVKKQFQRNRGLWDKEPSEMPVYGTVASQFNDPGVNQLFDAMVNFLLVKTGKDYSAQSELPVSDARMEIIPGKRVRYLSEIAESIRNYNKHAEHQADKSRKWYLLQGAVRLLEESDPGSDALAELKKQSDTAKKQVDPEVRKWIEGWDKKKRALQKPLYTFQVRGKDVEVTTHSESLSHIKIPKVSLPAYHDWGDLVRWSMLENLPGEFPFAAGVYPFKREMEDPTRMFAGEGGPERTNKRFHYLSLGQKAKRLSTAYDSVTLYGQDPDVRKDIYGKVGNSGVSVCSLDDSKRLYSGFDLLNPLTSVSMTINGPAPVLAAFFLNTAIDQACEKHILENGLEEEIRKKIRKKFKHAGLEVPVYRGGLPDGHDGSGLMLLGITGEEVLSPEVYNSIKADTLQKVRGTLQADILKEDQAQNTCLFSTDFSLKLMGDVQDYFIRNRVRNFYSVSISGYHIAEAGANPVTQLALTLSNGFTYVEYYLARGMKIDDFAPNLSFFFSNGLDPEFSVIGRVARIIWAKAIRNLYGGNERSQMLKYHIQTSGRSLHAQEIDFNDIRTTLQALYAIYDNCNSLHTNAYDEAITTPTEESVRRAMAIQLIINHELGLARNQNPLQGSFIIEELTRLVEEAVLAEFDRISERGGVLGAMERNYQRNLIQEESLYYEKMKNSGELPIMGVNTFLSSKGSPIVRPGEVIRATEDEKRKQLSSLAQYQIVNKEQSALWLEKVRQAAIRQENVFEVLMEAGKYCSLGQITQALFEVGGQYRRNI